MQHCQVRVSWQSVLAAQRVERISDEFGTDQSSGGQHDHAGVRKAETFGCDSGTEVGLVADYDVRSPVGCDRDQPGGSLACDPVSEERAYDVRFVPAIHREQGTPKVWRRDRVSAAVHCLEPDGCYRIQHRLLAAEQHFVSLSHGSASDGDGRKKMAAASGEGEQDPHRTIMHACLITGQVTDLSVARESGGGLAEPAGEVIVQVLLIVADPCDVAVGA
jgi:hypothetical protein